MHPELNIGPFADSDLDNKMLLTFLITLLAFTVFYVYILIERINMRRIEDSLDEVYQHVSVSR